MSCGTWCAFRHLGKQWRSGGEGTGGAAATVGERDCLRMQQPKARQATHLTAHLPRIQEVVTCVGQPIGMVVVVVARAMQPTHNNPRPPQMQEVVTCVGQPIGVVVAETEAAARAGARAVVVEYEELPALLDIKDAIAADSYYEVGH